MSMRNKGKATGPISERPSASTVKSLYDRLITDLAGLHDDVDIQANGMETRVFFRGELLCRLVSYRELLHIQIGDRPQWEIRIRDDQALSAGIDKILDRYLHINSGPTSF